VLATVLVALVASSSLAVTTQAPSNVTPTSAVLHGTVDPGGTKTKYWFEVGTTTAYGTSTNPASSGSDDKLATANHGIDGLAPATTYHVHLVAARDGHAAVQGADTTFTTPAAAPAGAPDGSTGTAPGDASPLSPAAPPKLGHSFGLAARAGSVAVRLPGAAHPVALKAARSVPVGSIVDTRHGRVDLTTQLPGGATQTGSFHGGVFQVRQAAGANGLTELVLRGPAPTCSPGGARAAATVAKHPPRVLWGHDNHGRFRTRASNAVITVRGTTWYVADRCDGTLTRVTKGSVAVRDLHRHRTVVVRAGHRYLAKKAH
jgi:hypothetical protein